MTNDFTSQLAANIWGHRFTTGQRGPEYVLEFLNVLYGTKYNLNASEYDRKKAIGLRKFIFEGAKEGSRRDTVILDEVHKRKIYETLDNEDDVEVLRDFLRNLEVIIYNANGKVTDRSWFVKMLYPLHESLLFFELRTNKNSISFERNFFARGGELYYLMLAYGTENDHITRQFIERRFKELLQANKVIEKVVNKLNAALDEDEDAKPLKLKSDSGDDNVPWLPALDLNLYVEFAKEIKALISLNIDINEFFQLLNSQICFHLMRYMFDRVGAAEKNIFFFDCMDGANQHISLLSSKTFADHESLVKFGFEAEFENKFNKVIGNEEEGLRDFLDWKEDPDLFLKKLGLSKLGSKRKQQISSALIKSKEYSDLKKKVYEVIKEAVTEQMKKNQLGITKILARDGGIANYRTGNSYRYIISDYFLQTLVYVNVNPKESIEFSEFLDLLYKKYNFVIGEAQAKNSGLYERSKLNIRYFQQNEKHLRDKLKQNGLLIEFSDATAMIRNPYEAWECE
ncbi:hypothetical protein GC097_05745 [Paenibacillus sp. LMG 31457]|uniref:DNA phosphorothioation-dependent restriction protein DptG n=2 Tax=Paenibacillus planticolens TaxID=2654976 RepID=A0ABX1ZJB4_9BACL|nr:hypothetical protein [Paenibacillus planticolens]